MIHGRAVDVRPPRAWLMVLAACWMLAETACRSNSVIALVIDTDMAVPGELDYFEVTVAGPSQAQGPLPVSVTQPDDPPFPRTMGLVDSGSSSSVAVTVVAFRAMAPTVTQSVRTQFVDGETRMLPVILTAACLGVACADPTQTCVGGACVAPDRPGRSLPAWTGAPPARPTTLKGEESLLWSAGWRSCAPRGGTLYCWGENDKGQVGNSGEGGQVTRRLPVLNLIPDPAPPTSVGLGYKHSCVCDAGSGLAYCWGLNDEGQSGSGAATPIQPTPVAVPGVTDCKAIAGGGAHTCVLRRDTSVVCWGRNVEGQTGQPASTAPVPLPRAVPGLTSVQDLRAGERFTCAVRTNGAVHCWGDNGHGQLGDGTLTARNTPARVNLPNNARGVPMAVTEIALGRYFACAQTESATVYCWGENSNGMIGSSPAATAAPVVTAPVAIVGIDDAVHIAAGHNHGCAIHRANAGVSCWGSGQFGQLGNGLKTTSAVPVEVLGLTGATALVAGIVHTCARTLNGVYCWGQNVNGQLGDGSLVDESMPVQVVGF